MSHAVLPGVQEDVLPVGHHGANRRVQHGHLRVELLHLLNLENHGFGLPDA